MTQTQGSNRGFAAMDEDKQREIASKGGKAAHEKGTAHEFSSQQAAEAGSKGGKAAHASRSPLYFCDLPIHFWFIQPA